MILTCETYQQILNYIQEFRGLPTNCTKNLILKFPQVEKGALQSIISHVNQKRMKVISFRLKAQKDKYYKLYEEGKASNQTDSILRIAERENLPPCMIARLILTKYAELNGKENVDAIIKTYLRDTTKIEDAKLAYEVFLCTMYDDLYSPYADIAKHLLGQQYEVKLREEVVRHGLAYRDEDYLRNYGYDKTPDVKLEVPIAVDGFIVNWIESKALFGDDIVHKEFGPGLVIYWFGFLETSLDPNEKRFLVMESFPQQIVQLQSSLELTSN